MIGNQEPRIKIEPHRSGTDGDGAAMLMSEYGYALDEWQKSVVDCWLSTDASGLYVVTSAGLSVARQNGKNMCLECRIFYGLVVNGERIIFSSHEVKSYKKAFNRLASMFSDKRHPEIIKAVKRIRYGVGEECIEMTNGGIIEFVSRSKQAARGFDGISLLIIDEAQLATDEQMESLLATLSASKTGTRQIIYTGTPPTPTTTGTVFARFREKALTTPNPSEGHIAWYEWSVAADNMSEINVNDKKLWYQCNPAMGIRLTEEFTLEELNSLSVDGFIRERLGYWQPKTVQEEVIEYCIPAEAWQECKSDDPKPNGKTAYGIKFSVDGSECCLAGCVIPDNGKARITVIERMPLGYGLSGLAQWLNERYKVASCVVLDGKGSIDVLIDKISDVWRFKGSVIKAKPADIVAASALLINEVTEHKLTWFSGQQELSDSAMNAVKRPIAGSGFGFGGVDSILIEAASLALYGCKTSKRNPQHKMLIG